MGEESLYPSRGGRGQLRTGVRPYFLDNPSCPFRSSHYPQLFSNKHPHPAAAGTTQPDPARPTVPKLKGSEVQPLLPCPPSHTSSRETDPPQSKPRHLLSPLLPHITANHRVLRRPPKIPSSPQPVPQIPTGTPSQQLLLGLQPIPTGYHPHGGWSLITVRAKQLAGPPASKESKWRQRKVSHGGGCEGEKAG